MQVTFKQIANDPEVLKEEVTRFFLMKYEKLPPDEPTRLDWVEGLILSILQTRSLVRLMPGRRTQAENAIISRPITKARKISAAGRRNIRLAQQKRWAIVKGGKKAA